MQPISAARFASSTDITPFKQNCPFHSRTIRTSFQVIEVQHLGEVAADRYRAAAHIDVLIQLRQLEFFVSDVVQAHAGLIANCHIPPA